jgi:hypothetical protein
MQIEEFSSKWQTWLNKQFPEGPGLWKKIKQALHYGDLY